ncbi:MAG: metallophosphoesterase [Planctomycetota bacterium]
MRSKTKATFGLTLFVLIGNPALAADTLVPLGATWKYLDNGSNQGTAWRAPTFVDAAWASGPSELGYGEGDEATTVASGPVDNHHITTYYRHSFNVVNPTLYTGVTISLLRDDGAIVYLNGNEIIRANMPAGTISFTTLAASTIGGSEEGVFEDYYFPATVLVPGSNVLAVEIHQRSQTSSDTSMNLSLIANTPADPVTLTRTPYLQRVSETEATLCWRTSVPSNSQVSYGLDPLALTQTETDTALVYDHKVRLTSLSIDTRYYYAVGSTTQQLAGGDSNHFVQTAPAKGSTDLIRIWVIGDSGTADADAAAVRDAYLAAPSVAGTDLWLMLGDNAYNIGSDYEYQEAVFDMYPTLLRNVPVWSTIGNHDGFSSTSNTQTGPYFDIFALPMAAEAGGMASGTESYYSFDYGNIHFICLDSQGSNPGPAGAMNLWLQADLAATVSDWIIAFWHHPPYTKGSHDSDDVSDSGGRMQQMRAQILPILESGGVDLVLCGHSHSYERSLLLDGHYGVSGTLTPAMVLDSGDGRADGDGAYRKPVAPAANAGAVYIVAGSSGKTSNGPLNHPAMFLSVEELGSLIIEVEGSHLDVQFLRETGAIDDYFRIEKGQAFVRGDANADGTVNVADAVKSLGYLFSQEVVECLRALDTNTDLGTDIADPVWLLSYLFSSGLPPAAPFPNCGSEAASALTCDTFAPCP